MKKLKTVFIEGTNEKYSFREDGVLFSNYINRRGKTIVNKKEMQLHNNCTSIYFTDGKKRNININFLKYRYFGLSCKECNSIFFPTKTPENFIGKIPTFCSSCAYKRKLKSNLKSQKKHLDLFGRDKINVWKRKGITEISKSYVAKLLKISLPLLTEEMYKKKKKDILTYREKRNNKNISIVPHTNDLVW